MSTESAGNIIAAKMAQFKQKNQSLAETVQVFQPNTQPIIVKPFSPDWPTLEKKLEQVINLEGLKKTVRELYDKGYGAEIETAMEIALAKAKKSPFCMFAAMVSRKSGNWNTITLQMVHDTWEVRRNALEVMEKLKLEANSTKAILALAWRLKGTIIRFLSIATEQGTGIRSAAGVFFALTKRQPDPA